MKAQKTQNFPVEASFARRKPRPSLKFYLTLMSATVLCLAIPSVSFFFHYEETKFRDLQLSRTIRQMRSALEARSLSLARSLALSASHAVAGYDYTSLGIMVNEVTTSDPEIDYCIIANLNNQAIFHTDQKKIGSVLVDPTSMNALEILKNDFPKKLLPGSKEEPIILNSRLYEKNDENQLIEAIAPVYVGAALWGWLRLGYSQVRLQNEINGVKKDWESRRKRFRNNLTAAAVVFLLVGAATAIFFSRPLLKSMKTVSEAVKNVTAGNYENKIDQNEMMCSELSQLSGAFNAMTEKLLDSYRKLDDYAKSLESQVERRTKALREAQAHLIEQAHEAGMAEMAVGILHNIGNAITPAKVSAVLLSNQFKQSPLRNNLESAMVKIHSSVEKDDSLCGDEKNRLASIIKLLPNTIKEEYDHALNEIERIKENHEHIRNIIDLQLRYARVLGEPEDVELDEVLDDALAMLDDQISKRTIIVEKDLSPVPKVKIGKSHLMQIVVNLIKNAYEAMDATDAADGSLSISVYREEGPKAKIVLAIKDNGIGFSSEEKQNLFKYGYTSKEKGSGFGLHSCANYLIANNGSIEAFSEGKGKGAEFKIKLNPSESSSA